jgi:hypothetical protein
LELLFVAQKRFAIYNQIDKAFGYYFYVFYSTSPEEFKIRLKEHHEQKSTIKRMSGEERKFSSLSNPKEDIAKCPSLFTKQKVRPLVSMKQTVSNM